jgi:2,4'-dihydroxyacetophenone dioxygenase
MTIPVAVNHQDKLLTIKTSDVPILRDTLGPGIDVQPLFIDEEQGVWVIKAFFAPGITLPRHFHTGQVFAYTLKGQWNYVEYPDQPQTAGSFLYEPGSSTHQFQTPATNKETTEAFFVVFGANVNFDEKGNFAGLLDAATILQIAAALGAAQGHGKVPFITRAASRPTVD